MKKLCDIEDKGSVQCALFTDKGNYVGDFLIPKEERPFYNHIVFFKIDMSKGYPRYCINELDNISYLECIYENIVLWKKEQFETQGE